MRVHHLHDGPPAPFYVSKFNTKPISNKPMATLAALQWAADREGQSYGRFILNLTAADQSRIQAEYETFQAEETQKKAKRPRMPPPPHPKNQDSSSPTRTYEHSPRLPRLSQIS